MKRIYIFLFGILCGVLFSHLSQACGWNMHDYHDKPSMWHGGEYYDCPYHYQGGLNKDLQNISGAQLFQTYGCAGCHTIGQGDKVGPDLVGLFKRRDEQWVKGFIQNPISMTQTDSKAKKLKEQYGAQMPQTGLSPKELDQLVEFLKKATW